MDSNAQRLLSDKFYDRRKQGALELESAIRNALAEGNHDRISRIVHQLCHDYAYAVHQPHARNGGLIGLAAAAIALGPAVSPYLPQVIPPVLACFSDQDARVRYYACESMYNIAKVAKGEILLYFNDVFDALCKMAADTELSVKNGAELLDRLVKDIVSESAASYASMVVPVQNRHQNLDPEGKGGEVFGVEDRGDDGEEGEEDEQEMTTAFSLPRFIPLLKERIHVLNPFTRTFLVSWITLLDSIPDLELVAYLPSFLGGLLRYLSDPNQDVHTTTKVALDRFLNEIRKIAGVKKGIAESRKGKEVGRKASDGSSAVVVESPKSANGPVELAGRSSQLPEDEDGHLLPVAPENANNTESNAADAEDGTSSPTAADDEDEVDEKDGVGSGFEDEWIPGQDVNINYQQILDILVTFLSDSSSEEEVQVTTLKWIEAFMDICPEDILLFTPKILAQVLPALSHDVDLVKSAAGRVNQSLMAYIISLPEDQANRPSSQQETAQQTSAPPTAASGTATASTTTLPTVRALKETNGIMHQHSTASLPTRRASLKKPRSPEPVLQSPQTPTVNTPEAPIEEAPTTTSAHIDLDYEAAVNALTLQFLHEHEATRVAALAWLIMLHRKSPRRILAIQDATFPALLKTLSDPAEAVVTRDLLLLSQISKSSDDSYFTSFMVNLLKLFGTDRRLLETRGNLIIRQLCLSLSAEKIYRTMADCLEQEEDLEFASIMVQNLNNNLITAPELADLRKRLRNLDTPTTHTYSSSSSSSTSSGTSLFTVLFRAWTVNAVASISLCLLAQAYEQAYHLLLVFSQEIEISITTLIQIDKLVQLLESPVFTYLRMQLLEPERFPYLYKCLYGLLMLLPQSSAFAALKNRLGSVSAIGYLGLAPGLRNPVPSSSSSTPGSSSAGSSAVSTFERQNRLTQRREEGNAGIRWSELLDRFKSTQDRIRRSQQRQLGVIGTGMDDETSVPGSPQLGRTAPAPSAARMERPASAMSLGRSQVSLSSSSPVVQVQGGGGGGGAASSSSAAGQQIGIVGHGRHKSGLSQLGRLARGQKGKKT